MNSYKNYLIVVLLVTLAFNYVDRIALGIVLQDLKSDLHLTDTQLGLLSGIAFAFFYSVMGIPIARWADRGNRVLIISLTTALWSVSVILCGVTNTFLQLLAVRVAVAVGEAGCIPPAHSLIADYFTRSERPRAVARYMLGAPLALLIGYFAAGWLNQLYGWRMTFILLGAPGLILAILSRLTLREPRKSNRSDTDTVLPAVPVKEVCRVLWSIRAFRHLLICFSVWYFFGYGLLQWTPAFFVRSHHLVTGELGLWLALIYGAGGAVGTYFGGEWATRFARGNERLQLLVCMGAFSLYGLLFLGVFLPSNKYLSFTALALANVGGSVVAGPLLGTMQTLVPQHMRATSVAMVYLFANLIGMGLGPLAAGSLSDTLRPMFGDESLRYALVILSPGYIWASWHLWLASKTIVADMAYYAQPHQSMTPVQAGVDVAQLNAHGS